MDLRLAGVMDRVIEYGRAVPASHGLGRARRTRRRAGRGWALAKGLFDRSAALVLVMLLALVLLIVAIAIRLDSPGPVFFRQRRRGLGGRPFTVLKFRTMADGASSEAHRRYIEQLATGEVGGPGLKKLTDDPRVTRVGRVLRKLSLDELPQLANVVAGQMSLVGPRPAIDYELEHYQPHHYARFEVKPGLTGLWQVSGRSELGFSEMLDLDVVYVSTAGPVTDARILLRTPRALIGKSA